nr:PREDICTED: alpha-tocopherol transfer protein-like [Bemisia tabaci]
MASDLDAFDEIKLWLNSLPDTELSDEEIKVFLHSCYGNCTDTKRCIEVYHSSRRELPEVFANRDPRDPSIQQFFKCFQIILSKERTDENFAVILIRATNPSVEYFDIASLFKAYFMTVDTLILEDPYCEGLILVFDVAGSSVSHLRKLNFGVLRKCIKYLEEGMPIRTKGLHVVNLTFVMVKIIQLVKTFLKSNRDDMTFFHSSSKLETLYSAVPQRCLPGEYGGTLGSSEDLNNKNIERLIEYREHLLEGKMRLPAIAKRDNRQGKSSCEDQASLEQLCIE